MNHPTEQLKQRPASGFYGLLQKQPPAVITSWCNVTGVLCDHKYQYTTERGDVYRCEHEHELVKVTK